MKKAFKMYSEKLKKEIVLEGVMAEEDGSFIISHLPLERLFRTLKKEGKVTIPEFDYRVLTPTHCFVVCEIVDTETNEVFRKSGESTLGSLINEKASTFPGRMAEKRAFDEAFISYLELPVEKTFTADEAAEVIILDVDVVSAVTSVAKEEPKTTAAKTETKTSSSTQKAAATTTTKVEEKAEAKVEDEKPETVTDTASAVKEEKVEEPKAEETKEEIKEEVKEEVKEESKVEESKADSVSESEVKEDSSTTADTAEAGGVDKGAELDRLGKIVLDSITSLSQIKGKTIAEVAAVNAKFIDYVVTGKIAAKSPEQIAEKDAIVAFAELSKK